MPVPAPQQFDIQPMLSGFSQGRAAKVALEDRQRALEQQATDAIIRAADLADTPEKWDRFITTIGAQFPDADLSEFTDFSSREAAIAQSMDPYQRAQLDLARRDQAMQERAFAAAERRANAPTPQLTDETVNGVLGQRNPATGAFNPYPEWMQEGATPEGAPDAGELRTEIRQLQSYKNYYESLPIYQSMVAAAGTNDRAADLNLVYGLAKIFDPTSVVREGEQILVRNTAGIPEQLIGWIDSLNGGGALEPATRAAIMGQALSRVESYQGDLSNQLDFYSGIAGRANIDTADLYAPLGTLPRWDPNAPPAGFVTPVAPAPVPAAGYGVTAPAAPSSSVATPAAPAVAPAAGTPDRPALTRDDIVATMNAWGAAGATAGQALQAIADRYGMTVPEVRALLER